MTFEFSRRLPGFVIAVLVLLAPRVASALDPHLLVSQYQKQHWQMEDGLPHNYVFALAHASDGYLLIGTDEGLARFDGIRFVPYDVHPSLGLSRRWILSLTIARDGSLWVGTFDGALYQWRGGVVLTRFEAGASVFDILEDAGGRIWASTRDGVLRRDSPGGRFEKVHGLRRPPDTAWNTLALASDGSVWVVTLDGLFRSFGNALQTIFGPRDSCGEVFCVRSDARGGILAGTSKGLFVLSPHGSSPTVEPVGSIPGPVVVAGRDRDGNIWAGTWGQGLYRANSSGVQAWSSRDGLPDNFVRQIYFDPSNILWIGLRGGGLNRWKDAALVPFGVPEGLAGDYASTAAVDPAGRLWLGTWRGGLYRFAAGRLVPQPTPIPTLFFTVRALAFNGSAVWTGNWEGLFLSQPGASGRFAGTETPFHHVSAVLFDRAHRLWVATSDAGLFVFPDARPAGKPAAHLLPGREVTSLVESSDGRIWAGTPSGAGWVSPAGLTTFNSIAATTGESFSALSLDHSGRIWGCTLGGSLWVLDDLNSRHLDSARGLPGYALYLALDDGRGALWISSARGILRVSTAAITSAFADPAAKLDYRLFDREDGMRTIECHHQSQPAGARDAQGRLWFPTSQGFVRIDPATISAKPPAPAVHIGQILVDGKPVPLPELRLAAGEHDLQIHFTALAFASPRKLRFRYRMRGLDSNWTWDNGLRTARYTHLPPAKYEFQVAAALANGPWSAPDSLSVDQQPRFVQTGWFALLLVAAGLSLAVLVLRWQMHLFRQRYFAVTGERNRIAREWHDTLLAGFSAISLQLDAAMLEAGERSGRLREILSITRKMVHHYRAEARRVIWDLRENNENPVSLRTALDSALRQAAEGRGISCEISLSGLETEVPKDVEHNLLRVCQEAISNAVRHGSPRTVRVDLNYGDRFLTLRVQDDGVGFDPAAMRGLKTGHFGLTIMQERMQRFGGTLLLASVPGKGTVVEASAPIAGNSHSSRHA